MRKLGGSLLAIAVLAALTASVASVPPGSAHAAPSVGPAAKKQSAQERKRSRVKRMRRANRKQKRPNIVVITTDDQDDSLEGLPNIARLLIGPGTTFTNSYVSYPLCCPSRATFLTGQYAHNHGVITSRGPASYNSFRHYANSLPIWLRKAGYRTAMVGKYLNGYGEDDGVRERLPDAKEVPRGWAEWYALTAGTDQRRHRYKLNENGRIRKYRKGPRNYVTDVLAGKAITFIKRRAPRPKPFFLWFNPTAPHGENNLPLGATRDPTPALRHFGRYELAKAPRTPNFNEEDVSDKPSFVRNTPKMGPAEIADVDRRHRGRLESLLAVDDAMKRIIGKLRKAGDMRKTYIIFTSDNGLQLGSHRLLFKAYLYEESTRVPLIIRGPRFPRGAVRDQLVSNVDLAPTIVELARARPGLTMDGRSLVPFAQNAAFAAGREALFESPQTSSAGIRSGKWMFIQHDNGETELYDLKADPWQLQSLHAEPPHSATVDQLSQRLGQLRFCSGGSCP